MQTDVRQMVPEWMTSLAVCSVGRKHGIAPAFCGKSATDEFGGPGAGVVLNGDSVLLRDEDSFSAFRWC